MNRAGITTRAVTSTDMLGSIDFDICLTKLVENMALKKCKLLTKEDF